MPSYSSVKSSFLLGWTSGDNVGFTEETSKDSRLPANNLAIKAEAFPTTRKQKASKAGANEEKRGNQALH